MEGIFSPQVLRWFKGRYREPTDIQQRSWQEIARGHHILATAPTGSGKTLTAFLWAIDRLLSGVWEPGAVRVLYISPLKALNNDIHRNLTVPLKEIRDEYAASGKAVPDIRSLVRSGDTDEKTKREIYSSPPEILIITPEGLNIILSSPRGRYILTGLRTVILDEVHSCAGTKRGTHLMSAVERCVLLSGEFQRIALSATVHPLEKVASFVGGYMFEGEGEHAVYTGRPVVTIKSDLRKRYNITITMPDEKEAEAGALWLERLASYLATAIDNHRSTLVFANSRRMVEKMARLINEKCGSELAYSHHGSLSREIRSIVEEKLKAGELKCLVATGTLELGIDVGEIDAVYLLQTPSSVSSAIQRVGRSNHTVGGVSTGVLLPTHGRDMLEAAVVAKGLMIGDIEPLSIPQNPLDLLAQVIISMCAVEEWPVDGLYDVIRCCYSYHTITRQLFDLVIEMLCGRYAGSRIKELNPKIYFDRVTGILRAHDGVRYHLYSSGGTIPDRGLYNLRLSGSGAKIGELDEEFVWERNIGDTFALGVQTWRVKNIGHNDIEVVPHKGGPGIYPFWRAESASRPFHLSNKLLALLEEFEISFVEGTSIEGRLMGECRMDGASAKELVGFLSRQRSETGVPLPHRHNIVIEHFSDPANSSDNKQVIIHTMWGSALNRPFAYAISALWQREFGYTLEVFIENDSILLQLPHEFDAAGIFDKIGSHNIENYLRSYLEQSNFFGAHFRENAARALLLPPKGFNVRQPLWLNRIRARKLFEAVSSYEDFPLTLESWRSCMNDEFDLASLKMLLDEIESRQITLSGAHTRVPSPFSEGIIWYQTNQYMYEDDTPKGGRGSSTSAALIQAITAGSIERPKIESAVIATLDERLKRTAVGYSDFSREELLQWVEERLFIPKAEWEELTLAIVRDSGDDGRKVIESVKDDLLLLDLGGKMAVTSLVLLHLFTENPLFDLQGYSSAGTLSKEKIDVLAAKAGANSGGCPDETALVKQWLSAYAGIGYDAVACWFVAQALGPLLDDLIREGEIICDSFDRLQEIPVYTTAANYEVLLRMARARRRPDFRPLVIEKLQPFLAAWSGIGTEGRDMVDALKDVFEKLVGFELEAGLWEEVVLPARIRNYQKGLTDGLTASTDLVLCGAGSKKMTFLFNEECALYGKGSTEDEYEAFFEGRPFTLSEYAKRASLDSAAATTVLWEGFFKGVLITQDIETVRKGTAQGFKPATRDISSRSGFSRWRSSRPLESLWHALPPLDEGGPFENLEKEKERARQLFRRYGILFRQLLENEGPLLKWRNVFKALRLMELSGEILSGVFFEGLDSLQFISHSAFKKLQDGDLDRPIWIHAKDPASLAGIGIDYYKSVLPHRKKGNYFVIEGKTVVATMSNNFKQLHFNSAPEALRKEHLALFSDILSRSVNPPSRIEVHEINGEEAAKSPYREVLTTVGFRSDYKKLVCEKRY